MTRCGFVVTLTFGNTKAVGLIVMNDDNQPVAIQVKGIQRKKSLCWNVSREGVRAEIFYVLVNLHADTLEAPEYFVLSSKEMMEALKPTKSGRDYIDYNAIKGSLLKNAWDKIRKTKQQ